MKVLGTVAVLMFASVLSYAEGSKPCEELKADIAKKLDAKGVKDYTLEIMLKDKDADGKVIGSCENGTKKIVYSKTTATAKAPAGKP